MSAIRWAAAAVTAVLALMNVGTFTDKSVGMSLVVLGFALGVAGLVAAGGLAFAKPWGRNAVVGIGIINTVAAIIALLNQIESAWIGLMLASVGVVLGLASTSES